MKNLVTVIILSFFALQIQAQTNLDFSKNAIYGGVSLFGLGGTVNVSYERVLFHSEKGFPASLAVRVGGGGYAAWLTGGPYGMLGLTALTGRKKHHLELGLAGAYMFDEMQFRDEVDSARYAGELPPERSSFFSFAPAASVGYRYQKMEGGFLLRAGLGLPEGVYLGLGVAF